MYLEFWKLKEKPFENTPDGKFLYPSPNHRDALQKILYAVGSEKGCAMLSGEYGCGKTVLVRTLVKRLDLSTFEIALINYPVFDRESFLKDIIHQFGQETEAEDHPELQVLPDIDSRFEGNVEVGGLLLCENSTEYVESRREAHDDMAQSQIQSVDNNYLRQSDPRMPVLNP